MKTLLLLTVLISFAACNKKGGAFSNLEDTPDDSQENVEAPVEIVSYTPIGTPVVMTSSTTTTYAVAVNSGAGEVTYDFLLDGVTSVYSGTSPFYSLAGSSLTAGSHTLKVTATNSVSSDDLTFNLRRNRAPAILSSTPSLSGNTVNCDDGTLTFNALTGDGDADTYTQTWLLDGVVATSSTPGVVITNSAGAAQLAYTPSCSVAGFHQITLRLNDTYEITDQTWSVAVANPAVETIISYFPTSNNITYLSTDSSKTFNVTGSGVGSLTFTWKLDGTTIYTQSSVTTSNLNLLATSMSVGTHTLRVDLTDSTGTNDPATPARREWTVYKNQKPRILSPSPSAAVAVNLNTARGLTASIEDALDTFTTTISKGALDCVPASECGLSTPTLPTTTGSFSTSFTAGTAFLGENTFTLRVEDSYGEYETQTFTVTANYFSDACNSLDPGEICTLIGLPGLGSGTNVSTNGNRVRISPSRIIQDERGNFFISDRNTNTIWYYNTTASSVTLLGVTIPANTVYVVAGTGIAGAGANGADARKQSMNFGGWGGGMAWDSTRQELFVADYTNSRVLKIDSTGKGRTVCGLSNLTTQGAIAKNSTCTNPSDLAFDTTNRRLYVVQLNSHIIKVIDASNSDFNVWPSYILAGVYGTAANTAGTSNLTSFYGTQAGTSRLSQPLGLYLDESDQILYFSTYANCRFGAIGLPGATSRTVGGATITAGNVFYIAGNNCGDHSLNTSTALGSNILNRPTDLWVHRSGTSVLGVYLTSHDGHRVMYINNTASPVSIGGQTIAAGQANNVFGNGTQNAPTNPPTGRNSVTNRAYGLVLNGTTLYVGNHDGNIIRTLDISSGTVSNYLGGTGRAGYSGNGALDSILVTTNNPQSLLYKEAGGTSGDPIPGNMLFFSDTSNAMIRSINLITGRVEDFIGTGSVATETLSNTVTTATRLRAPQGMTTYNGHFLFADQNNNCFVRGYNPFSSDETILGTTVQLNKSSPVAGNPNTCGNFVGGSALPTTDLSAMLSNPWGIGADEAGNKIYVASSGSHCILRITDAGFMSPFIGTCGTIASSVTASATYNDPALLLRAPAEIVMDTMSGYEGNFFFIDFSDQATANIKYVNLVSTSSVDFFGGSVSVDQNEVDTVLALTSSPGYVRGLAIFENWICYASGTGTNGNNTINCRNRTDGDTKTFGIAGEGGIQREQEHEGASVTSGASTVTFASPGGLAFDSEGNLYVTEQGADVIRKIKRWFP